jgi:hypothetical protein
MRTKTKGLNPEGVWQESPGRKPWVSAKDCRKPCMGGAGSASQR